MPTNEFLPFGTGTGANVLDQAAWAALAARAAGFSAGMAKSAEVNKALRQPSLMAAALGQFLADYGGKDALDNGDLNSLRDKLLGALNRLYAGNVKLVSASTVLTADDAGLVRVDASAGNVVLTLPAVNAANGRPLQFRIVRVDGAADNTMTVQRAGADSLDGGTSITLAPGERVTLSSDGVATWYQTGAGPFFGKNMQVFTSSGTFTVPAGVTRVKVRLWGGGGGGGGSTGSAGAGSGGGGGAYFEGVFTVTPGLSYTVTIGNGGSGSSSGTGSNGGTTSFGSLASCAGGKGGQPGNGTTATTGGAGGTASGTGLRIDGFHGGQPQVYGTQIGGGLGGCSFGRSQSMSIADAGQAGLFPGNGGNGGAMGNGGGAGAKGLCIVEW